MTAIPELLKHAKDLMHKAVENTRREFSGIRTGKATTSLLDIVRVDAYGSHMPLNQVAMVAAPEPRLLTVQPFDKGLAQAIEKAIRDSDLGLNPATQGGLIRVPIPSLTEERRRDLVKVVHKRMEEAKVEIRAHRRDAADELKKREKAGEIGADEARRELEQVEKLTHHWTVEVDRIGKAKEQEIMEV